MENKKKDEKVIMEAKLEGGAKKQAMNLALTEATAADSITKSLINDFMLLLTVAGLRAVFAAFPQRKELIQDIRDSWTKRMSTQLESETKKFQTALFNALSSQEKIDTEVSKKMEETLNSFCRSRDRAVELANKSIDSIIDAIIADNQPKEENPPKEETKEERPSEEKKDNEPEAK